MVKMGGPAPGHGGGAGGKVWVIAAVVVAAGLIALIVHLRSIGDYKVVDDAGCLTNAPSPVAALFLVDATDRLTPESAKYVIDTIRHEEDQLPRYSRVTLVPFGDNTAQPLEPKFSACLPGASKDAGIDENGRFLQIARDKFDRSLEKLQGDLAALPPSKSSPISGQVIRAAGDPVLKWSGAKRRLVLLTDGLESSIYWSRELKLSAPPPRILDGVDAEFVELGNIRNGRLQSDQMRQAWKDWFQQAGASVRMTAPGYAAAPD